MKKCPSWSKSSASDTVPCRVVNTKAFHQIMRDKMACHDRYFFPCLHTASRAESDASKSLTPATLYKKNHCLQTPQVRRDEDGDLEFFLQRTVVGIDSRLATKNSNSKDFSFSYKSWRQKTALVCRLKEVCPTPCTRHGKVTASEAGPTTFSLASCYLNKFQIMGLLRVASARSDLVTLTGTTTLARIGPNESLSENNKKTFQNNVFSFHHCFFSARYP